MVKLQFETEEIFFEDSLKRIPFAEIALKHLNWP